MTYTPDQTTSTGNRGSHYNKGAEYLFYVNELNRGIYRQPVNPATMIAQQAPKKLSTGQTQNLNGIGAVDLKWTGMNVQGQNGAKVIKLTTSAVSLDEVAPSALTGLTWGGVAANNSVAESGQTPAPGNFYAVQIPVSGADPHYAKVRVYKDGTDTKIEWVTYTMSTRPWLMHTLSTDYPAPHDIVVSAYESDLYVSGGDAISGHYVIQIPRVLSGAFPQYSAYPTPIHDAGISPGDINAIDNPQQLVVDGGIVYVVAKGGLFRIDSANNRQVRVVDGIADPVGLLLDAQGAITKAYISDALGSVFVVDIGDFQPYQPDGTQTPPIPAPSAALSLGGASGFLTWADETHAAFYATLVDAKKVVRVDLVTSAVTTEETVADFPWSVEAFDEHSLTVICDAAIGDIERGIPVTGVLMLGIGLIPFGYIHNSEANPATPSANDGTANTPLGYYFGGNPYLPFAGSLSLMLNHEAAWTSNIRYYKVTMSNDDTGVTRNITGAYNDMKWNPSANPPRFEMVSTGAQNGLYPIRNPSDLWYNPFLSAIINTSASDNNFNRLKVEFYNANKQLVSGGTFTRLIFIDNSVPTGKLFDIRLGSIVQAPAPNIYQQPDMCGLLAYSDKSDLVAVDLFAYHSKPGGTYSVSFKRGNTNVFSVSGSVATDPTLITISERSPGVPLRIGHLTGDCDIANISISLGVPSRAINGYSWINLGASSGKAFTLAPSGAATHTTWTAP